MVRVTFGTEKKKGTPFFDYGVHACKYVKQSWNTTTHFCNFVYTAFSPTTEYFKCNFFETIVLESHNNLEVYIPYSAKFSRGKTFVDWLSETFR